MLRHCSVTYANGSLDDSKIDGIEDVQEAEDARPVMRDQQKRRLALALHAFN